MLTIGVLASGKGSNLQAIADYIKTEKLSVKVGAVLTDNPESSALAIAEKEGIDHLCIPEAEHKTFLSSATEKKYVETLKKCNVELVCMAGFMRVLKKDFMEEFPGKIINIHPSLLPAFQGLAAWEQALRYGVQFTGCTTHFVECGVDTGPVILQAVVPVLKEDTAETLHRRIQEKEHVIYPLTVRLIAEGRISLSGRRVYINN
ncbi:MAG: phosphoribosylglycinamide formyltransferase [Candidatus Omnitrophica bacterium]|nr:phosphoribosylglycinamide formyltransferase [Candidatus Omnitrophota bacterium]